MTAPVELAEGSGTSSTASIHTSNSGASTSVATMEADPNASSVQVAVRVRPMLPYEVGNTKCVEVLQSSSSVHNVIRLGGDSGPKFTFDQVFPLNTTQQNVYLTQVSPLVSSCLEGYNATILAYGQTGSGKTHTIMGPSSRISSAVQDEDEAGVIPRAIRNIFDQLEAWKQEKDQSQNSSYEYDVRVQFLEVYGEDIRDLLTTHQPNKKLSIREVGMQEPEVVGATEEKVDSAEEALLCLTRGMYRRVTGATAMNESSSRSHAIFSLIVEQSTVLAPIEEGAKSSASGGGGDSMQQRIQAKRSKFNFVDLAGSERQKRTQASGQRLKEGININQGLLVLGNVISALGDPKKRGKTFVPYRDSKLTRLLKGSLGGNHKTLMIACVSPASVNMEETLNCLRYANRAKNIQNRAVVNLDATSRMVEEMQGKIQLLASDLLRARDGNVSDFSIPLEVVKALAKGEDSENQSFKGPFSPLPFKRKSPSKENFDPAIHMDSSQLDMELQRLKAENEVYRLRLKVAQEHGDQANSADVMQKAFMTRAAEYEREIAWLKAQITGTSHSTAPSIPQPDFDKETISGDDKSFLPNLPPRTPSRMLPRCPRDRSESPELSRLRAQVFGSMSESKTVDAEVEAEEKAVEELTSRYLGQRSPNDDEFGSPIRHDAHQPQRVREDIAVRIEAEMHDLATSITAKEELIQKLQASQEKYEAMRGFYEEKLKEMEALLAEKEHETEVLSEELKNLDKNHDSGKELAGRLKLKQEEVTELKRKQAELSRLTRVASKNESHISKLQNEVLGMKQKKVELQKQLTNERKSHALEVQKLKKEAMQKDRELNKVKKLKDQKSVEAQRAQQVAKSRLEQVNLLKSRYKESEKKLRMQTVKNGLLSKAGLDPVMVGRRQYRIREESKQSASDAEKLSHEINIDGLRDKFDQKVAEVGRSEALAEKLAQEWEEHLSLSSQRAEVESAETAEDMEYLQSLDSQIKYKEGRIRQLAAKLGKKPQEVPGESKEDVFLFSPDIKEYIGNASPMAFANIAAKVLFGMVVRERRRIATLARTASALDERVQVAEAAVEAKDNAFRAYVDEQRLEAAELAQNQQQHILSLMEMVREAPENGTTQDNLSSPVRSAKARHAEKANSKLLLLANERISVLEQQLQETQLGREAIQKHREREDEARQLLDEKTRDYEQLEEQLNDIRAALRHIREEVTRQDNSGDDASNDERWQRSSEAILSIVSSFLHPTPRSETRARRSKEPSTPKSPSLTIRRQTEYANSSDSDEIPDWADDIIKDLAIIAEGKIPNSLMKSPDIANAETPLENPNVFDRLTNPDSFTGVQKQKNMTQRLARKHRSAESVSDSQRQRKLISKQVKDSLDKLVVPGEGQGNATTRSASKEKTPEPEEGRSRSVFDRLLSPSNLTGTQKQRFHEKKSRRELSGSSNTERADEAQSNSRDEESKPSNKVHPEAKEAEDMLCDILDGSANDSKGDVLDSSKSQSSAASRRDEYKDLDVFERLNRTTTQAYAVKQHVNIAEKMLDDLLDRSEKHDEGEPQKPAPNFERVKAYAQQNVFERLQKTTTHAFAVKQQNSVPAVSNFDSGENKDVVAQDSISSTPKSVNSTGEMSDEVRSLRSNAIATGSFTNASERDPVVDEEPTQLVDSAPTSMFSPISSRIRSRRRNRHDDQTSTTHEDH